MRLELSEIKTPAYIFPMSCVGIVVYHMLKRQGAPILGFCDNNKANDGNRYDGCPVVKPEQAAKEAPNATFIITSCRYRKDMVDQLKNLGVSNIIYAEEILTPEKAEGALRDFDDSEAAKIITEFVSPKTIAQHELPLYFIIDPDFQKNVEIVKEVFVHYNSIGYEAEYKRFNRIVKNAECVNFVIIFYASLTRGSIMNYISYLLDSKVLIKNIIIQISYDKICLKKAQALCEEIETLGIGVKKYYLSELTDSDEPVYNYTAAKTFVTMIVEDTPYNHFEQKHKCIFLHIPKTAGTGLHNYIGNISRHFFSHKPSLTYKAYDEKIFNDYFKFAIVRNPWDRLVSQYFYEHKLRIEQNYDMSEISDTSMMHKATFKDAVLALKNNRMAADLQHEWICDENDNILADFVGRFENLAESYEYIAKKIGVYTGKPLEKINASKHKPYQEYYDEESKDIVGQYFKKDIEMFGYTFD